MLQTGKPGKRYNASEDMSLIAVKKKKKKKKKKSKCFQIFSSKVMGKRIVLNIYLSLKFVCVLLTSGLVCGN